MTFDIKLDAGFTHKARIVADVNNFYDPIYMVYDSVVSKYSVQTILILESLNYLDVWCTDMQNFNINVKPKENL